MSDEAYIEYFAGLSVDVATMSDFSDGLQLFNLMHKVSPDYFDVSTLAPSPGSNWPLRLSNLKKLTSNLTSYYTSELLMETPLLSSVDLTKIAKDDDEEHLKTLLSTVILALISCPTKASYIQPIMSLSPSNQSSLKGVIETTMGTIKKLTHQRRDSLGSDSGESVDFNGPSKEDDEETKEMKEKIERMETEMAGVKTELEVCRMEKGREEGRRDEAERHNEKLQDLVEELQGRLEKGEGEEERIKEELTRLKEKHDDLIEEHSTLQTAQKSANDELEILRSKSLLLTKSESNLAKARARIEEMEPVVVRAEEVERKGGEYLDRILRLEEENKDVKIMKDKAEGAKQKLIEAEKNAHDSLTKLKAKMSQVEQLKAQLQTASTTSKMFETELSNLKAAKEEQADKPTTTATLQQPAAETKEKIARLEFENESLKKQLASNATSNDSSLSEALAEAHRKIEMTEKDAVTARDEADEFKTRMEEFKTKMEEAVKERERKEVEGKTEIEILKRENDENKKKIVSLNEGLTGKDKEREELTKKVKELTGKVEGLTSEVSAAAGNSESFKEAIAKLTSELKAKEEASAKLREEKANIQSFYKQTLQKFQDKYLVALQGCRQKVKDERARCEMLEERLKRDKASQKREEKLMSATVYELGLRIMQERVKS
mmetsp:Transcript_18218/g.37892  ORF Transcript_18218/g.37892 Transcript_18218/m.37892 type:complete len:663 (+) Transcript_18218:160-2148(+)